ncbi:biotin--[acetyl-CoA-carboxylase] ligase [Clostridium sp. P21]|uniref:Bifunctional ligase/repressor BirA n=1 Tax=Clostridium muellerianum TaxID=2716538 RepID=A0A7Y0HRH6_9CLOT|nr:biotin--[acetyl-CoA-carboxylase] ligase [Clostridium muellerianum]NMM64848.1 biotin--[acetyl-CoA-carboxylase] ligase [Clostridium muellerianum]
MKNRILHLLKENEGNFISGQIISEKLGVSRTAIWKYINTLRNEGYHIDSISNKGYNLTFSPDLLSFEEINENLTTKYIGRNLFYFESLDSTNTKAKELALKDASHGTIIISEEQTAGKGRLGRFFLSPKYKGIWISIILRPDIDPLKVPKITQIGAAAVVKACEAFNINVNVKWPNDIILNNKKVCGILTEMSGELNKVNYVVMGIGVNANIDENDFPEELKNKATSISIETKNYIKRKEFVGILLNNFEKLYEEFVEEDNIKTSINICRKNSILIGKEIKIINRNKETLAKALDLDENGELIVELKDGNIYKVVSGEVSIRGINDSYTPQ